MSILRPKSIKSTPPRIGLRPLTHSSPPEHNPFLGSQTRQHFKTLLSRRLPLVCIYNRYPSTLYLKLLVKKGIRQAYWEDLDRNIETPSSKSELKGDPTKLNYPLSQLKTCILKN